MFSIQIYCDFSGYSDIAIGSAKMLGFRLIENFKAPYFSESIGEFWNRWHISLNTWFKDYVYILLGGSRKGFVRKCINLFVVFLLSGIWHGANWTFVIWGCLNGVYRVVQELIRKLCKPIEFNYNFMYKVKKCIKIITTYILVCISWIFFRANNIDDAIYIVGNILENIDIKVFVDNLYVIINNNLLNLSNVRYFYCITVFVAIAALIMIDIMKNKKENMEQNYDKILFRSKNIVCRWSIYTILTLAIIFLFTMQNGIYGQTGQFIYFQF